MARSLYIFVKQVASFTLFFGALLSLLAWRLSMQEILPIQSTHTWAQGFPSMATAGFPWRTIEIPPSPMGDDHIPADMLYGVVMNYVFWFAIAMMLSTFLVGIFPVQAEKRWRIALVASLVLLATNKLMFMLWFD